jgi:hypothetical protein
MFIFVRTKLRFLAFRDNHSHSMEFLFGVPCQVLANRLVQPRYYIEEQTANISSFMGISFPGKEKTRLVGGPLLFSCV